MLFNYFLQTTPIPLPFWAQIVLILVTVIGAIVAVACTTLTAYVLMRSRGLDIVRGELEIMREKCTRLESEGTTKDKLITEKEKLIVELHNKTDLKPLFEWLDSAARQRQAEHEGIINVLRQVEGAQQVLADSLATLVTNVQTNTHAILGLRAAEQSNRSSAGTFTP